MQDSYETSLDSTADSSVEVGQEVLVRDVLSRGKIPKLKSGDKYTINALIGVVAFVLGKHHVPATDATKNALLIASADVLEKQRGIKLRAAVGEMNDFRNGETTASKRTAYLSEWRDRARDLSTALDGIEQEVVARLTQLMVNRSKTHPWAEQGLNIAVGRQLGKEVDVSRSRVDALRLAIVGRVMESTERHASVRTPDESAAAEPDDAIPHTDGDIVDGANDDYADSDPEVDLNEFTQQGIDPTKPSQAKPGSEERILHIAACYAAGEPLWKPGDENEMTSPADEEMQRSQRVAESERVANRVREDLKALTDH